MDADLKARWVKALRSGKYAQGRRALLKPSDGSMCCLGVLATIQGCNLLKAKENGFPLVNTDLPRGYGAGLRPKQRMKLADLNDGARSTSFEPRIKQHSFPEIADYIEREL